MTCFVGDVAPPNNQHPWEQKQKKAEMQKLWSKLIIQEKISSNLGWFV